MDTQRLYRYKIQSSLRKALRETLVQIIARLRRVRQSSLNLNLLAANKNESSGNMSDRSRSSTRHLSNINVDICVEEEHTSMAWPLLEQEDISSPLVDDLISCSTIKPSGLARSCTPVQMNQTLWMAPKGRIHTPKDRIHIPKDKIHTPKDGIHALKDKTHTPKERIHIPKERTHIPKERTHPGKPWTQVGANTNLGTRRLKMTPENFLDEVLPEEIFADEVCDLGFSSLAEVGEPILCGDAGIDLGLGTLTHVGHDKVKRI